MGLALNYSTAGVQYAIDVVDGKVDACGFVKAACRRQIDDLESPPDGYNFSAERANKVCLMIEQLPHIKGEWAQRKERLSLEPWQCFIYTTIFGWLNAKGHRRFRVAYIEIPRNNAKTTMAAAVGLYMLSCDGESGAECYAAATNKDQADIAFTTAKEMALNSPEFRDRKNIIITADAITQASSGSIFRSIAFTRSNDGFSLHFGCIDELHEHKDRRIYDVLESATGSRRQALLWCITTAGTNKSGICFEQRAYTGKILAKTIKDESHFGIIYTIDKTDDWRTIKSAKKANPNWGISVFKEEFKSKISKAKSIASAQNPYTRYHLNVWTNADERWINSLEWEACKDVKTKLSDFKGQPCWIGVDLASKVDIACTVALFPKTINGQKHFFLFGRYYLPENTINESNNDAYAGWQKDGHLTMTEGNRIDYSLIESDLAKFRDEHDVQEIGFDPWQATQFSLNMEAEGFTMVQYAQNLKNLNEPMHEMEALVKDRKIHHADDPVLTWMIGNVVCHVNAKDQIYPRKETRDGKIDGVIAALIALALCTLTEKEDRPFDKRGIIFV